MDWMYWMYSLNPFSVWHFRRSLRYHFVQHCAHTVLAVKTFTPCRTRYKEWSCLFLTIHTLHADASSYQGQGCAETVAHRTASNAGRNKTWRTLLHSLAADRGGRERERERERERASIDSSNTGRCNGMDDWGPVWSNLIGPSGEDLLGFHQPQTRTIRRQWVLIAFIVGDFWRHLYQGYQRHN